MKQVIIARKDLGMSPGKLAAQVSHASMAFLSHMIQDNSRKRTYGWYPAFVVGDIEGNRQRYRHPDLDRLSEEAYNAGEEGFYAQPKDKNNQYGEMVRCEAPPAIYHCAMDIPSDLYENWLGGIFTKVVCEAKNRNAMDKAIRLANELGLQEGVDYFLIKDCCLTELTPEEVDEDGVGRTLTCIGFRPLPADIASQISKKFQLFK